MYGRKLRLPMDIVFTYRGSNENTFHNVAEFKSNLSRIYDIVRENMNARQDTAASYYDRSVMDDELELHRQVYVFNSRSRKFCLRWEGPFRILKCEHPSYLVAIEENGKLVDKWYTRDKLRRLENKFKLPGTEETKQIEEDEDISSEDEYTDIPRSQAYNLRDRITLPDRYGSYVTHFVETCFGEN